MVGRLATVLLFVLSSSLVFVLDSAKDAFDVILQIGAGTGLLYLIRWFWWRVNAWCEVAAMVSSFLISLVFLILAKNGIHFSTHAALLTTIAFTTVCWVTTAFVGPVTDRQVLIDFYAKVRPFGRDGGRSRTTRPGRRVGRAPRGRRQHPLALLGWVAGCTMIWSSSSPWATSSTGG